MRLMKRHRENGKPQSSFPRLQDHRQQNETLLIVMIEPHCDASDLKPIFKEVKVGMKD